MFLLGMKSWCGQKSISIVVFPPPVYYFPPLLTQPKEFIFLIDFATTGIWNKLKTKIKHDFNQLGLFEFKGECHFQPCLIVLVALYWNFFVSTHVELCWHLEHDLKSMWMEILQIHAQNTKYKGGGTRVKLGRESLCQNNQTWNCNSGQSLCRELRERFKYEIQLKIL